MVCLLCSPSQSVLIEAALAAPRPAKEEATRGAVLIGGPICRHMFTYLKQTPDQYAAICF